MKLTFARAAASCALIASASIVLVPNALAQAETAPQEQSEQGKEASEASNEQAESGQNTVAQPQGEKAKDERICRRIRADMSSRRKTKVCRTPEEWRELNNPR